MKRFLKNVLIFFLAVGLITASINVVYIVMSKRSNAGTMGSTRDDNDYIRDVPDNIQICNFGSSHGICGFNYSRFPNLTCFNFALGSQYLSYDYRILQQFQDHLSENAVVFIDLAYFSFFGKDETTDPDFLSKNRRYYYFLRDDLIKEYDAKTDFYLNYLPALVEENCLSLVKALFGLNNEDTWNTEVTPETAAIHGPKRYEDHVQSRLDENGNRMYSQGEIDAARDIALLCHKLGAHPIFVTTPYLSEYPDAVQDNDPAFFDDFYRVIDKLCSETDTPYYDYSRDERFSGEYSLFIDTDHLNRRGAEKFTCILLEEVLGIQGDTNKASGN